MYDNSGFVNLAVESEEDSGEDSGDGSRQKPQKLDDTGGNDAPSTTHGCSVLKIKSM